MAATLAVIIQLIFLECLLSLDNAAVLGAMVAHLPDNAPIPWPKRLPGLWSGLDCMLGPQRCAALKVGLFGAYLGRALMLLLASVIISVGWVRALGALYLLGLTIQHFADMYRHTQGRVPQHAAWSPRQQTPGFWAVVLAIEFADLAFSLDNVLAAVALSDRLWVVMMGVAIGMITTRFAATIFTRLIAWEPALEHGAYLLLLAIGAELLFEQWVPARLDDLTRFAVSMSILALTVILARVEGLAPLRIIFRPWLWLCGGIQMGITCIFSALLLPLRAIR